MIGQIQELAKLDAGIAERTLQRETEAGQRRIVRLQTELKMAGERKASNEQTAEQDKTVLAAQQEAAAASGEENKVAQQGFQARYDAWEKLRTATLKAEAPGASPLSWLSVFKAQADLTMMGETPPGAIGREHPTIEYIRGRQRGIAALQFRAGEGVREAGQGAAMTSEDLQFRRSQIRTAETDEERAQMELEQAREEQRLRQESAPGILNLQRGTIKTQERLNILNVPSTSSTGGFGSASETNDLLRRILAVWETPA